MSAKLTVATIKTVGSEKFQIRSPNHLNFLPAVVLALQGQIPRLGGLRNAIINSTVLPQKKIKCFDPATRCRRVGTHLHIPLVSSRVSA